MPTLVFGPHGTDNLSPDEVSRGYAERSPLYHPERLRQSILLQHGDIDKVVPISQAYQLNEKIRASNGTSRISVFEGEGHGWKRFHSQVRSIREHEAWWRMTLLGLDEPGFP